MFVFIAFARIESWYPLELLASFDLQPIYLSP